MDTNLLIGTISLVIFFGVMLIFVIHEHYEDKRHKEKMRKEDEEWERKMKDPEYREKRLNEFLDSIDHFNKNYSPYGNYDHTPMIPTSSRTDDSFHDIFSPTCPYGIYTW